MYMCGTINNGPIVLLIIKPMIITPILLWDTKLNECVLDMCLIHGQANFVWMSWKYVTILSLLYYYRSDRLFLHRVSRGSREFPLNWAVGEIEGREGEWEDTLH